MMKFLLFGGYRLTGHNSFGMYLRTLIKRLSEASKGIDVAITLPTSSYKRALFS